MLNYVIVRWLESPKSPLLTLANLDILDNVGEPEFMGFRPLRGRNEHNFGIPIHNSWDEKRRNLWDPSIIHGTALQPAPFLTGQA